MQKHLGSSSLGYWITFVGCWLAFAAQAHQSTNSYLAATVADGELLLQWEIALGDLQHALPLDSNGDGIASWAEVRMQERLIFTYALSRLQVQAEGQPCALEPADDRLGTTRGQGYAVLYLVGTVPKPTERLALKYEAFFDVDPAHRGLLRLEWPNRTDSAVFTSGTREQTFLARGGGAWRAFGQFVWEGIRHIWIGLDHILFLVALLLPSVVARRSEAWEPVGSIKIALLEIVKVVTAFTIAHSITLSLAMLGWVRPPARWVESVIALSVILAALNNLRPVLAGRGWMLAFGFGLIHGFGFANVLDELGLARGGLALALTGFNVGVELGQLAIVGVFLPIAFALRSSFFYRVFILKAGSVAVASIAAIWLFERAFEQKWLPF